MLPGGSATTASTANTKRKDVHNNNHNSRQRRSNRWSRGKRKRQKIGRRKTTNIKYWIQECEESSPFQQDLDINLIVSRVDLTDNYRCIPSTDDTTDEETDNQTKLPSSLSLNCSEKMYGNGLEAKPKTKVEDEKGKVSNKSPDHSSSHDNDNHTEQNESKKHFSGVEAKSTLLEIDVDDANGGKDKSLLNLQDRHDNIAASNSPRNSTSTISSEMVLRKKDNCDEPVVFISMHSSCRPSRSSQQQELQVDHGPDLPNGDCGDGVLNPYPKTQVPDKYWAQRRRLFTRFDQGIQVDKEGWYSVTPEAIANHIATRLAPSTTPSASTAAPCHLTTKGITTPYIIMDAFVGVGGNAIAFARQSNVSLVVCVDLDRKRLEMAASNCRVYDIPREKVIFIHDNACSILQCYRNGNLATKWEDLGIHKEKTGPKDDASVVTDSVSGRTTNETDSYYRIGDRSLLPPQLHAIFLSPPWGGVDYKCMGTSQFDFSNISLVRNTVITDQSTESPRKCETKTSKLDGKELLQLALQALPRESKHANNKPETVVGAVKATATTKPPSRLAMFLPRNTNGIALARAAWEVELDEIELEQQFLSSKLKTLTMYANDCVQNEEEEEDDNEDDELLLDDYGYH